jgi:hypothetical protein
LDILPGVRQFEQGRPLADQLKVIPAAPGSVAVFFPAVKEASGLRFHLHGPFVPELSRASIREAKANIPLFEQLAALAAQSLHRIKELGLLTPEFLFLLPNPQDQLPPRYQRIRTAIVEEMKSQPLTPTHDREHAPAGRLIQARASLKALLSESDIEFLVDHDDEPPLWAMGATQRNSRIDHFLSGLDIREWGPDEFMETLREKASDKEGLLSTEPDEAFLSWLKRKSPPWTQELYALLHSEARDRVYQFRALLIVREQEKILAELESRDKSAVPDRPLANPERRAQNVREQAVKASDKESEIRQRSVSIGREEVKEQADTYLREHYRNADGEVTCQICKRPLPFKLDDGREYFEVVEFVAELRKRHPQNYLALCPNHSAMFRLVNGSKDRMREAFQALQGNELSVLLSEQEKTVYFSKTHIIDLKAVLEAERSLPREQVLSEDDAVGLVAHD